MTFRSGIQGRTGFRDDADEPLGHVVRDFPIGRGRRDHEFFAADAEGSVGRPCMLCQEPSDPMEDDVPGVVPTGIIGGFEAVDVGEDQ